MYLLYISIPPSMLPAGPPTRGKPIVFTIASTLVHSLERVHFCPLYVRDSDCVVNKSLYF